MTKVTVVIPDDLLKKLRMEVVRRYGGKKGDLSKAVNEAIEMWIEGGNQIEG